MMQKLLAIESSATVCSVVLCEGESVLAAREIGGGYHHAAMLTSFIQEVFRMASVDPATIDAVAVSKGPGSYTGLRIGVSVAKGICYSRKIPLIGISLLEAMAMAVAHEYSPHDNIVPMIDAGRMEVYTMTWNGAMKSLEPLNAKVIDETTFLNRSEAGSRVVLVGSGAKKFREMFSGFPDILFRDEIAPSAKLLVKPAIHAFNAGRFEDVAYFEPLYLKEFVAGKPRVKGLR